MVTSVASALLSAVLLAQAPSFEYDRSKPVDVKTVPGTVTVQQLTYAQLDGSRNAATLVTPGAAGGPARPAVLFLHWYEPPRPTSNRTEFLAEAVDLAASGVVSLLVDTPWAKENWFPTRDAAKDYELTIQMTKDVRRALDALLAQPGIDTSRVALVGHDFGAMWGALAAASDPRITHLVYAAGTRSFTDWYLFTPKKEGAEKDAFVAKLAPLDPIAYLPKIAPRPLLLQFGTKDPFVKNDAATAMAEAVTGPKTVKTYEFEHELTYQSRLDRLAWLREQFKLAPAAAAPAKGPDAELRELEETRRAAIRTGDFRTLATIYAEDFTAIAGTGQIVTRAQLFDVFTRNDPSVTFVTDEISVRLLEDSSALFSGRLTGRASDGRIVSASRFTHVFVLRDGRWRCVFGQSTALAA